MKNSRFFVRKYCFITFSAYRFKKIYTYNDVIAVKIQFPFIYFLKNGPLKYVFHYTNYCFKNAAFEKKLYLTLN